MSLIDPTNSIISSMNTKLMVNNIPFSYSKNMINDILKVFGDVKALNMLKDPATGEFRG